MQLASSLQCTRPSFFAFSISRFFAERKVPSEQSVKMALAPSALCIREHSFERMRIYASFVRDETITLHKLNFARIFGKVRLASCVHNKARRFTELNRAYA